MAGTIVSGLTLATVITMSGKSSSFMRRLIVAFSCALYASGCYGSLPPTVHAQKQTACWQPDEPAEALLQQPTRSPTVRSGFLPIHGSMEALDWRLALVDSAQQRIDAQYFIWRMDETGRLLLERLLQAADRGVQVRLLLDDLLKGGLDEKWGLINTHPNMEVRLFNPFRTRQNNWLARGPEWLFNMSRLNHRMHNKLFMVDGELAIVGGRNIGNEYFGLGSQLDYRDFDLLAWGPIAEQLDDSFDVFWNSAWTYSPQALTEYRAQGDELGKFREQRRKWLADAERLTAMFDTSWTDSSARLRQARDKLVMAPARVVYDCPPGTQSPEPLQVVAALREVVDTTQSELFVVSPYVVLNDAARDRLRMLASRGVKVSLLTNSLEAVDHTIVFGAYARRRDELLTMGVAINEFKPNGEQWPLYRTPLSSGRYLSVHAKILVFDEEKIMVGSLNLDPRSKYLNTEIGLLIRSKELAAAILKQFNRDLSPQNSWRVRLDEGGSSYWVSAGGTLRREPARSFFQRLQVFFFSLLPIDSQL